MKWRMIGLSLLLWSICVTAVNAQGSSEYKQNVDTYRDAYSQYQIKNSAYISAGTFASEEELILSAQKMLVSRADVWASYWQLEKTTILGLSHLSETQKKEWQKQLNTEISSLAAHRAKILAAKTKSGLLTEAQILNKKQETYSPLAFSANSIIASERLKQGITSLQVFNQNLAVRVNQQQLTNEQKEIKNRGLTVNAERLGKLLDKVLKLDTELKDISSNATQTSFVKIPELAGPLFSELSQLNQVLTELSEGVEW